MYDQSEVQEERRLAYVGITRAREKLYLTNARLRMLFGSTQRNPASRFIGEISDDYLDRLSQSEPIFSFRQPQENRGDYGKKERLFHVAYDRRSETEAGALEKEQYFLCCG